MVNKVLPRLVRRAFSLVEVLVVVVILGILAAMVVPQFSGATESAQTTSVESTLGTVRSSIAAFRTRAVVSGGDPYPSLNQLTDRGVVLADGVPHNPFTRIGGVQSVSLSQARDRAVMNEGQIGWNYYVDNNAVPPTAEFYANSREATTRKSGGVVLTANKL